MRTRTELDAGWRGRPTPSGKRGRVHLVVARRGGGEHAVLERGRLTPEGGLEGDRWAQGPHPEHDRQVTVMERWVAQLVADDQPLDRPGDNLVVELELSAEAAPVGTRLRAGTCVLEVTAKPHTGCKKFEARFGRAALEWINAPEHAEQRLRGINCRVVEAGEVAPGDVIENLGPASR